MTATEQTPVATPPDPARPRRPRRPRQLRGPRDIAAVLIAVAVIDAALLSMGWWWATIVVAAAVTALFAGRAAPAALLVGAEAAWIGVLVQQGHGQLGRTADLVGALALNQPGQGDLLLIITCVVGLLPPLAGAWFGAAVRRAVATPPAVAEEAGTPLRESLGLLVGGQTVSAFGDAFSMVAMPLLILRLTGSVAQMGAVAGVSVVGQLLGGVVAGPLVDRVDRRRLLLLCDAAQMLLGGSIPVVWWCTGPQGFAGIGLPLVYSVVAVSSVLLSVYQVGLRSVLPSIVGRDRLSAANGRLTTWTEAAHGIGPALAGLAVAAMSETAAIGINAVSYGVAAVSWLLLRTAGDVTAAATAAEREDGPAPLVDRFSGLRFLWSDHLLRNLGIVEAGGTLLVAGATSLFIYYIEHDLGSGSVAVGVTLTLASGGAVAGAVLAERARAALGFGRAWLLGLALQAAALTAVVLRPSLPYMLGLAALFAFGRIMSIVLAMTFRQHRTPNHLLGRVSAAVLTITLAAQGIGSTSSTSSAEHFSTRIVFVAIGVGLLALVLAGLFTPLGHREPEAPALEQEHEHAAV